MEQLRFAGTLSAKEQAALMDKIERLGFAVDIDGLTGLAVAKRPEVVRKQEFTRAIVNAGVEDDQYAHHSWRTAWNLSLQGNRLGAFMPRSSLPKAPMEFVRGTTYDGATPPWEDRMLVIGSLSPTIGWARDHYEEVAGLTMRVINTWESVAEAFPQPDELPLNQ